MAGREASLTKLTDKRLKIVRFVLGPALIVTGLFLWNDLLGEDMSNAISHSATADDGYIFHVGV